MRLRIVVPALLAGLILALPPAGSAEDKPVRRVAEVNSGPSLVIRLASIDQLIQNALYLAKLAGKEEEARQGEGVLKALISDKGLEGFDTKRPLALYARFAPKLLESSYALMLPVADEKSVQDLLGRYNLQGQKEKEGIYKIDRVGKSPVPVYYRFTHKYLYITAAQNAENLTDQRLLNPEVVLAGQGTSTASAVINFDQIPEDLRKMALGTAGQYLGVYKALQLPNETEAQRKARAASVDEFAGQLKALLEEGQSLRMQMNINPKAEDLSVSATLTARPGSGLARTLTELGQQSTIGASLLSTDAAANLVLHLAVAEKVRPLLGPALEEGYRTALQRIHEEGPRHLAETVLKAIDPTLKMAELDLGANLVGPGKNNHYTGVLALKVKDGAGIETAIKNTVKELPPQAREKLTLDVDKAAGVSIHRVNPDKTPSGFSGVFGDGPIFFAVRADALLVARGEEAMAQLKKALAGQPRPGKILQLGVSMAQLIPMIARDNKAAPQAASQAFKAKGSDRIEVVLEGGQALQFRAHVRGAVLHFFALAEHLKK